MGGHGLKELAAMPPGPTLAAVLERLDPASLTDEQAVPVLRAWSRQRAHDHARMAATLTRVATLSRAVTGPTSGDWAGSEIAAALTWTEHRAAGELEFAEQLAALPLVGTAFDTGRIDHGKARVFTDLLNPAELTPSQVEVLCATYLPAAPRLTSGQLRHRLTRALLAIDPDAVARRYRRAVTTRQVVGYLSADGTAVISATGLPAGHAAAACARVDDLAEHLRRAGHPGTITQIRADVFLRLLDGSITGHTTAQITAALLAQAAQSGTTSATHPAAAPPDDHTPPDGRLLNDTSSASAGESPADDRTLIDCASSPAASESPADGQLTDASSPAADESPADGQLTDASSPAADESPADGQLTDASSPAADESPAEELASAGQAQAAPAGVEIRVGLTTLLGLDQRPAEIPGWGPVLPDVARDLVGRYRRAPWRFAILDDDGHLLLAGITRHRPAATERPLPATPAGVGGGLVELHVTARQLAALVHDPAAHPAWAAVIADLDAQFADRRQRLADLNARPHSRHARGPLLRHMQVRDRTCVAPGCRRAARRCDADHTHAYTDGGATTEANVGPLCPRHHALKHRGGWQLRQARPGHFHWRSPLGQHYTTRGEPIMPPLPAPRPGPLSSEPSTARPRYVEGPSFEPRPPAPPPTTDAPRHRYPYWKRPPPDDPANPAPF